MRRPAKHPVSDQTARLLGGEVGYPLHVVVNDRLFTVVNRQELDDLLAQTWRRPLPAHIEKAFIGRLCAPTAFDRLEAEHRAQREQMIARQKEGRARAKLRRQQEATT